ncbi:MAG: aminotransferase class IV [Actinobacteria bacterium]|nr:aminotransferase class IV [Actinomycetota bacterium]
MTMLMLNGRIEPVEKAVVPAMDRGLTQGLGLYETLKLLDGVPVFFHEHVTRMNAGLATLRIDLPEDAPELARQIVQLAEVAGVPNGACRVLVTAGPPDGRPTLLIQVEVREFPAHPLRLISYHALRSTADMKSKSFTTSHLAMQAARAAGADDALFVDEQGRAHEATTANLFVRTAGRLLTPPLDGSILPGVVRTKVMEVCAAAGDPATEHPIVADELGAEDQVLLTSSVRGLVTAQSLDGRALNVDEQELQRLRSLLDAAEQASAERFRRTCL